MFRASLCPSSGEQECALLHWLWWLWLCGAGMQAVCTVKVTVRLTFIVHTACIPDPHSHSHHYQCRTPYAAVHTIVLLMMGIMMPQTCWDKSLIINIRLVASCWFLSLHPTFMMHGHKSLKLYMFQTVPLSIIRSFSLYTQQWYMSYRFADRLLTSCQQTCMYCRVYSEKPLMVDGETVPNA